MAHPIFDRCTYAWDRKEADNLFEILVRSISDAQEIEPLYIRAGGEVGSLNTSEAPRAIWRQALELLAQGQALRKLCKEVLPSVKRLGNATKFHTAIRAAIDAVPAIERKIIAGVPVLDRQPLRGMVDALRSETSLGVLLVRGGPKTGKTHGRHLFLAGAADEGAEAVYLYAPMVTTVDDVVTQLFSTLGFPDEVPARDTTLSAWYSKVCQKLRYLASTANQRLWVAIDDLGAASEDGAPLLDPEITKFCEQVVLHMANPAFAKWFRLMLIHYPEGPVPTRWLQEVWREDCPSGNDGNQQDVVDYLNDWAGDQDGRTFLQVELEELAAAVIAKVDAPPPEDANFPRLQRLHYRLTETLRSHT